MCSAYIGLIMLNLKKINIVSVFILYIYQIYQNYIGW